MPEHRWLAPVLTVAVLALSGCPGVLTLTSPTGGKSPGPASRKPSASPTAKALKVDACREPKAGELPARGGKKHGAFTGQALPAELAALGSEAEVRRAAEAIKADPKSWQCFQDRYPGATVVAFGRPADDGADGPVLVPAKRPTPAHPETPVPGVALCASGAPATEPAVGRDVHGKYKDSTLPSGWDKLADEKAITAAIAQVAAAGSPQFACFQKFYPRALKTYEAITGEAASSATECHDSLAPGELGTSTQGAFQGRRLPDGWHELADEAAVIDAIAKLDGGLDWGCYQRLYPDVIGIYFAKLEEREAGAEACVAKLQPGSAGRSIHGAYNGQRLVEGWSEAFATEAEVTEAIRELDGGPDWVCFKTMFGGATTVYSAKK